MGVPSFMFSRDWKKPSSAVRWQSGIELISASFCGTVGFCTGQGTSPS